MLGRWHFLSGSYSTVWMPNRTEKLGIPNLLVVIVWFGSVLALVLDGHQDELVTHDTECAVEVVGEE
ncbi:hypothetical protein RDE2_53260 (plasmid) [Rhodococcus sp. RDE2]|nr:hypothetical protein RDE2_53260 [Rhodococcus sp. RDE2]